jgi:predicted MFS family arabinose efflux permease
VHYAPPIGIRGLWVGPYFADVHGAGPGLVGTAALVMGLAMVAGNFAYGPLDRLLGTRKWVILPGNLLAAACLLALWAFPAAGPAAAIALLAGLGFFGSAFGVVMAHGRAFVPAHLAGRGVTLLNLFGIGGAGVMQFGSARIHAAAGSDPEGAYGAIFLFFGLTLLAGCLVYLLARDRVD